MPKVAFFTLGCKVNQSDTGSMEQLFKNAGYEVVDFNQISDVYIINTCVVTNLAQSKSRQIIRRAIKNNANAVIAVTGCYPQIDVDEVMAIEGVSLIVGNEQRKDIVQLVEQTRQFGCINVVNKFSKYTQFEELFTGNIDNRTRAFLKIQEGCNQFCTYCIIPYARGPLRSRSLESIKDEAQKLVETGFKEIVLIGIHLGAYGAEDKNGYGLANAVKTVLSVDGIQRVRLGSLESIELDNELIELIKTDKRICNHLHLPLQSGCDEILKSMNRPYDTEKFSKLIEKVRSVVPDIAITTDVIVGFPGETPEQFEQTRDFVAKIGFSKTHIFPFSIRKGTPAEKFTNQVTADEKSKRAKIMSEMDQKNRNKFLTGFLDRELSVLFEQICEDGKFTTGLSSNYLKVFVDADERLLGEIRTVKIKSIYKEDLFGEIIF